MAGRSMCLIPKAWAKLKPDLSTNDATATRKKAKDVCLPEL